MVSAPGFVEKLADETAARTPEELLEWLKKVGHPVLKMPPMIS